MDQAVPAAREVEKAHGNEGLAALSLDEVLAELMVALDGVRESLTKGARFLRSAHLHGELTGVLKVLEEQANLLRDHARMNLD